MSKAVSSSALITCKGTVGGSSRPQRVEGSTRQKPVVSQHETYRLLAHYNERDLCGVQDKDGEPSLPYRERTINLYL